MANRSHLKTWFQVHKWSSLVCTLFLLLLCLTGLPLIFHEEIAEWGGEVQAPLLAVQTGPASLDSIRNAAKEARPQDVIQFMFWNAKEHPDLTYVSMISSLNAPPDSAHVIVIDSRTAKVLDAPSLNRGFMFVMLKLHTSLFAGLPGTLFLGLMGLLFVIAIISGIVLYHPFMRKLDFGVIRTNRSSRLKWLDVHNLFGVVIITWALVVGLTGTINTLSQVIIGIWQRDQLADMLLPYQGLGLPKTIGSLDQAMKAAKAASPEMDVSLVAFPGTMFSSPHHYAVYLKGNTPVTSKLLKPALIDTQTGKLTDSREMPWYVKALLLSQPLHFGDYGGLPLKIIWSLLDIFTLSVLISGLYLWWERRGSMDKSLDKIEQLRRDFSVELKGDH